MKVEELDGGTLDLKIRDTIFVGNKADSEVSHYCVEKNIL